MRGSADGKWYRTHSEQFAGVVEEKCREIFGVVNIWRANVERTVKLQLARKATAQTGAEGPR